MELILKFIISPMTASCTDSNNVESFCSFQCPPGSRVRIPNNPNRICDADGTWHGDVPQCCEQDGCPGLILIFQALLILTLKYVYLKNSFQMISELISISFLIHPVQSKRRTFNIFENTLWAWSKLCQLVKIRHELESLPTILT